MAQAAALAAAAAAGDAGSCIDKYNELVDAAVASSDKVGRLTTTVEHALSSAVLGTVGRAVCEHAASAVAERLTEYAELDPVGTALLELFRPHGQPLATADYTVRRALFNLYMANEDFESAAAALAACIAVPPKLQATVHVDVAQCYLLTDDSGRAEMSLRRIGDTEGESRETILRVRACRAQLADLQRNYQQAAARYAALSQLEGDVEASELEIFLERAATCAILDRAGPQRQRLLNKIYRDPRAAELPCFVMLEKMCRQRLIRKAEADAFRATLRPHHLASAGDGGTVFDRAVREHNVLAASLAYTSISFASLGELLGVDAAAAERAAARMVEESRLEATIDQVAGMLEFGAGTTDELAAWDGALMGLFGAVTSAVDAIGAAHPHLVPA